MKYSEQKGFRKYKVEVMSWGVYVEEGLVKIFKLRCDVEETGSGFRLFRCCMQQHFFLQYVSFTSKYTFSGKKGVGKKNKFSRK
jgi:hypothetical protein